MLVRDGVGVGGDGNNRRMGWGGVAFMFENWSLFVWRISVYRRGLGEAMNLLVEL